MSDLENLLFVQSATWIATHPHAMNTDVPDPLLELWTCGVLDADGHPNPLHLEVFYLGYVYAQKDVDLSELTKRDEELLVNFCRWQEKLHLAKLRHYGEYVADPMPLFVFPTDEQCRFRLRPQS